MSAIATSSAEQAVAHHFARQLERVALFVDRGESWSDRDATACIFDALRHIGVLARFLPALRTGKLTGDDSRHFQAACADAANYFAFAAAKATGE
jgi:hypothetical protein